MVIALDGTGFAQLGCFGSDINTLTPPVDPVRVELTGPRGDIWAWGPEDAADRVTAAAYEFCLVLTRRRPLSDSAVHARGRLAIEWMEIAQPWFEPPRISDMA